MTLGIFIIGIIAIALAAFLFLYGSSFQLGIEDSNRFANSSGIDYENKIEQFNNAVGPLLGRVIPIALLGLGGALLFNSFFVEVPAGTRGVCLTFKAASDGALEPGLQFKWPWQDVATLSTQKHEWTQRFECQSKDLQKIDVTMTLVYARKPDKVPQIYKRVRANSEEIDVKPGGRETLKAAVAEFDAAEVIQNRKKLSATVTNAMNRWIDNKDLLLIKCSISDVDFEESYDERVESKVVALEKAREAQNELLMQKTMADIAKIAAAGRKEGSKELARGDNESRQIVAEADAYKTEVVATAEAYSRNAVGTAEAERTVWMAKALGDSRAALTLEAIKKWDGDVPDFSMEGAKPKLPFEFLQTPETLNKFESPVEELEELLVAHQAKMAADASIREQQEAKLEQERIEQEKLDAQILNNN